MAEKYLKKVYELLLVFMVFLSPLVFFPSAADPFWITEKFFFIFAMSLTGLIFMAYCMVSGHFPVFKTSFTYVFLLFLLVNVAGFFPALSKTAWLDKIGLNFLLIVLFYFVYLFTVAGGGEKLIFAVLASGTLMAFYGILQALGVDFIPWAADFSKRASSTLGNPDFLGGHMVVLLPVALAAALATKNNSYKRVYYFYFVVMATGLIMSQTRGAYIAFGASAIVFFLIMWKYFKKVLWENKKKLLAIGVGILILATVYLALRPAAFTRLLNTEDEALTIRGSIWKNAASMIKDNFVLGSGPGNFSLKYSFYQAAGLPPEAFKTNEYYKSSHAHNDYLQFVAEYGIGGLLAMLLFFFLGFYKAWKVLKMKDKTSQIFITGLVCGAGAMLFHAMFNFPFLIIPTSVVFYIFIAMVEATENLEGIKRVPNKGLLKIIPILGSLLFMAFMLMAFMPLAGNTYLGMAKRAEHFGQMEKAYELAKKGSSVDKYTPENFYYLGSLAEKIKNEADAYAAYTQAVKLNPGYWEALVKLFTFQTNHYDAQGALKTAWTMHKISPYTVKAIMPLAYALYQLGKYNDSLAVAQEGLKYMPAEPMLLNQVAAAYGGLKEYENSILYAKKAIEADTKNADSYMNLAVAYYMAGEKAKAVKALRGALLINPENASALNMLKVIKNARK